MWAFKFLSEEHIFFNLFFDVIIWSHRSKRKNYSKDFSKNLRSIILTISLLYPSDRKKRMRCKEITVVLQRSQI